MNETDLMKFLAGQTNEDNKQYDTYATQFITALPKANDDEGGYWHGRLIGYGASNSGSSKTKNWKEYQIDFLGETYTEREFRQALKDKKIVVTAIKMISKPEYVPDTSASNENLDPQVVTYKAEITATIDGQEKKGKVCLTHHIRRTYLAYRTEIKDC